MKSQFLLLALVASCLSSVSCISTAQHSEDNSLARNGWSGASEFFSGPPAIFFAPVLAIGLIILLWVAAYNTLRSPPPKIGFGGGAQGGGPWGWETAQAGGGVSNGGWPAPGAGGWAAGSEYAEAAAGSDPQAQTVATAVEQTVASTGQRSFNDMTHRILSSIERGERGQY